MNIIEKVENKFKELFEVTPLLLRSPGRVNLIGEHTDYNMGFVLPAAIDKAMYFGISARKDTTCKIFSLDMNELVEADINRIEKSHKVWANYLIGVVEQFRKSGRNFRGFNCVFGGDIPIGAGLSSSAAIEAGLAYALNTIFNLEIDKIVLVKMAQRAENEFVGVQCGIMDQYINIFGEQDSVLRIDCRSLEYKYYPFPQDAAIVLFDSGVKHSLASSAYNRRKEECSEGVEVLRKTYPEVTHLRDVTLNMLNENRHRMSETVYHRCKYVVEENERLLKACVALEQSNLKLFGKYMYQSHEGLSREYEVSCPELDYLVELVKDSGDIYGSRMMGGGFGGCTINLIVPESVERICSMVTHEYKKKFGVEPKVYITSISIGTRMINVGEYARA